MADYQANKLTKRETNWHLKINQQIDDVQADMAAVESEVDTARGAAPTLDARLDVALNEDGTLKGSAPASGWWTQEGDSIAYQSAVTFTVAGDKRGVYTEGRSLKFDGVSGAPKYSRVVSASYTSETLVTVRDEVLDSNLSAVHYGQPDHNTGVYEDVKKIPTETKTDDYTVTASDFGKTLVMNYASAKQFTLPSVGAGDIGAWFRFVKTGAGKMTIQAADSDVIADSGAGGSIYNDDAGETFATITIQLVSETMWAVTGGHGTWVTTQ